MRERREGSGEGLGGEGSARGGLRNLSTLRRLHRLGQRRQHLVQVADDAVVGDGEDRRVGILVDGDDAPWSPSCRPGAGWRRRCPPRCRAWAPRSAPTSRSGGRAAASRCRSPAGWRRSRRRAPCASSSISAHLVGAADAAADGDDDVRLGEVDRVRRRPPRSRGSRGPASRRRERRRPAAATGASPRLQRASAGKAPAARETSTVPCRFTRTFDCSLPPITGPRPDEPAVRAAGSRSPRAAARRRSPARQPGQVLHRLVGVREDARRPAPARWMAGASAPM